MLADALVEGPVNVRVADGHADNPVFMNRRSGFGPFRHIPRAPQHLPVNISVLCHGRGASSEGGFALVSEHEDVQG